MHEGKPCSICYVSCSQKIRFKRHMASVHEGNKPYNCSMCSFRCTIKTNLKPHVEAVHEGRKSQFVITVVQVRISRQNMWNTYVHEGEKP